MRISAPNFLIVLFCLWVSVVSGQVPSHVFNQLSIKDGLSDGTVRAITEDKRGFIWFGTEDGLNKYDGYKFTVYKPDPEDNYSVSNKFIKCFFNDSKGNLWIGTKDGINIYDSALDRFYNQKSDRYASFKYIREEIEGIYEDRQGVIWVLTGATGLYKITSLTEPPQQFSASFKPPGYFALAIEGDELYIGTYEGLIKFNKTTNTFEDLSKEFGNYYIRDIYMDPSRDLWLATNEGLKLVSLQNRTVKAYSHDPSGKNSINGNNTIGIIPDKGRLLIAIDGKGIDALEPLKGEFFHYTRESGSQLNSNNITSIYKDSKGTLWAGTFMNGINFSNSTTNFFVSVKNNSPSDQSVRAGVVTHFLQDSKGTFWISTDGGGVFFKEKGSGQFSNYTAEQNPAVLNSNAVICLLEDSEKNIWISTYSGGLTRISPDGHAKIFYHDPEDTGSLGWNKLNALTEYRNEIWVSTYGRGISVYNKTTGKFRHYKHKQPDPRSLPSDWTYWFLEDSQGILWIATHEGLCRYMPETDHFRTYKFRKNGKTTDNNYVFDIFEDSRKNLWIGTNGNGLILFDRDKETFKAFTTSDGLSDNAVKTIIEDNSGLLWLATNNGLTKFFPETGKAVAYTIHDGLPAASFSFNSKYKDEEGRIYFGTNDGYVILDPALSDETLEYPPVVLTELSIFNIPVSPGSENSFLQTHITEAKEITLPYDQNSIAFEFASLNFSIPRQNYYSYLLEGFDRDWNYTGKKREAKYTNLDPGKYIFKVRASNNEKEWNDQSTEFTIVITPPFWETWWFRSVGILTALGGVIGFIYFRTHSIRQRNKWLQDQVQERTLDLQQMNLELKEKAEIVQEQRKELLDKKYTLEKSNEKLAEYNEFQQKLIGIIAHDIRGPLQRFSALLRVVDENSKDFVLDKLKENAGVLSLLATDLLSWVSFQSARTEIEKEELSWKETWDKVIKEMGPFIQEKQISVSVSHHNAGDRACGVSAIAHASMRNILSNAVKFSEKGGLIEVETGIVKDNKSGIRITDFGKGFDAGEVNKLIGGEGFNGMKSTNLQEGAGLGMTFCNDMIKRCGGIIEAASLPGSGATFYIFLPASDLNPAEIKPLPESGPAVIDQSRLALVKDRKILLVDDDDELRWALVKYLGQYMAIHEVRSGEEALEWLDDNAPDLALVDIRMSGISGIEVCRKIKNSKETAHVPCLIISGETGENIRLEAFSAGADSFLNKPLNSEEILLQIIIYFENHEKQIKRFFTEDLPVDSLSQNEFNKEFLQKVVDLIESNLSSPELTVEFLAKEMGLSKSTLYRNLKSLTGQSANSFIKNIRMRRSLLLLKEGKLNISEVSSEMGFNSLSYFTTTFKKHFGFSPTKLKDKETQ